MEFVRVFDVKYATRRNGQENMKANDLKKGMAIRVDNQTILIKQVVVQSPSSRSGNTLYKARGQNVVTRQKFERSFKSDEAVETVEFSRRPIQLLFRDADGCTFMDNESYEQFVLPQEMIEDDLLYISDGLEGIQGLVADDVVIGMEIPPTVVLEIMECAPGIKGASASARTKPATLTTGLVVQVPEYLEQGEQIKINTETGTYMSRA
jgi:elongation factor P